MADALELPSDDDGIGLDDLCGQFRIRVKPRTPQVELPEDIGCTDLCCKGRMDQCCKGQCTDQGTWTFSFGNHLAEWQMEWKQADNDKQNNMLCAMLREMAPTTEQVPGLIANSDSQSEPACLP